MSQLGDTAFRNTPTIVPSRSMDSASIAIVRERSVGWGSEHGLQHAHSVVVNQGSVSLLECDSSSQQGSRATYRGMLLLHVQVVVA